MDIEFCQKLFFASIEVIIWLLSVSLLIWCITLIYLWILSHFYIPERSPTWLQCMILLMYYWIWFPMILLVILHICFSVIFAYNFLSFFLSFFGWCFLAFVWGLQTFIIQHNSDFSTGLLSWTMHSALSPGWTEHLLCKCEEYLGKGSMGGIQRKKL